MVIDPTTPIGILRLRCGDVSDLPFLPDAVYNQTYTDSGNSVSRAATTCAKYILAQLAFRTHRKMGLQLEVWGSEAFDNYKSFLLMTISDPTFSNVMPVPYSAGGNCPNELLSFMQDFKRNYYEGTQSQELAIDAVISPNDGSRYGPYVDFTGWSVP